MGELLPQATTPWLVWEKTLHKNNTNYDNYIRESMHNEYDLKQKVFAYSKQTIQGLHNGIPPGEYVTYSLDQNRQLRPYHNGMIPFNSNNIKNISAKSFEINPIAGTAADVSNLASAAGNELPFSLDNMGDISDAMYQEPLNPHNPLSAAFAAAAFEKESKRLGEYYQQHKDRQLFNAHNLQRTIQQSNGLYYEPNGQNTPLQTSKTKSDAVYHSFPNFGLGNKGYTVTNDFINKLDLQEPYMQNVGNGTWGQALGLNNTAKTRDAESKQNALEREVDQETKIEATDQESSIPTWLYETDEHKAKRLKTEAAAKNQNAALAIAETIPLTDVEKVVAEETKAEELASVLTKPSVTPSYVPVNTLANNDAKSKGKRKKQEQNRQEINKALLIKDTPKNTQTQKTQRQIGKNEVKVAEATMKAGLGGMAYGAAVGSTFGPGIGTIIGAAAGYGIGATAGFFNATLSNHSDLRKNSNVHFITNNQEL